jgi:hypothetical protein
MARDTLERVAADYSQMTVKQLRKLIVERELGEPWMGYYLKKRELVRLLEVNKQVSEVIVTHLRTRQAEHMTKARQARKDRAKQFGITSLTAEEKVQSVLSRHPGMAYVRVLPCPEGFESATGSTRGKHAIVFADGHGVEVLLTKQEARLITRLGVRVPATALRQQKSIKSATAVRPKTLRDVTG